MLVRYVFRTLGLAAAVIVFAAVHSGELGIPDPNSSPIYIVENGVERELTADERHKLFGEPIVITPDARVRALPAATFTALVLLFPCVYLARRLQSRYWLAAHFLAVAGGGLLGAILSYAVWIALGGWAPPMLVPAVAAGAILALTLLVGARHDAPRLAGE